VLASVVVLVVAPVAVVVQNRDMVVPLFVAATIEHARFDVVEIVVLVELIVIWL
jgi:hypothetical protein